MSTNGVNLSGVGAVPQNTQTAAAKNALGAAKSQGSIFDSAKKEVNQEKETDIHPKEEEVKESSGGAGKAILKEVANILLLGIPEVIARVSTKEPQECTIDSTITADASENASSEAEAEI